MFTSFDLLLLAAALLVMAIGFARRRAIWMAGQADVQSGNLGRLLTYLIFQGPILKRRSAGWAHLCLFWGFFVFIAVVAAAQFEFRLPLILSRVISLILDVAGLLLLIGVVFFLIRSGRTRATSLDGLAPKQTSLPALLMTGIVLTGFLAEGLRLGILSSGFSWEAPVGFVLSQVLPRSPLTLQLMIRLHMLLVLIFVALVPFTFMRHIGAAALNVYYQSSNPDKRFAVQCREARRPFIRRINDFSWKQLLEAEACVSCGRCVAHCPASLSEKALSPRSVIQSLLTAAEKAHRGSPLSVREIAGDDALWACTTCMACVAACPVFVRPAHSIIEFRRQRVMGEGALPSEARPMMRDLRLFGDTYAKGPALRTDWALNCDVPVLGRNKQRTELLIWVGCAGAYHPRYREVSRALIDILKAADADFAILGQKERCCGDPARRLGDESLFKDLALQNIGQLNAYSFDTLITLCPHCLQSLKHEYAHLGGSYEVRHASELVAGLIRDGSIQLKYPIAASLSIHDPCYLGRVNHVFEPLREIGRSVPETKIIELRRNRENGFCCGGGGGQMWLHESRGQRINHMRSREVIDAQADMVATACPYCLTMLQDGMNALEAENPPSVKDIVEVVAACMHRKAV